MNYVHSKDCHCPFCNNERELMVDYQQQKAKKKKQKIIRDYLPKVNRQATQEESKLPEAENEPRIWNPQELES